MQDTNKISTSILETPLGKIIITASPDEILSILFSDDAQPVLAVAENEAIINAKQQLNEYFSAQRTDFDLPLAFNGSGFQNRVWKQLREIHYGKTISYLQLAKNLGDAKCIRAAASANGKNPFAIVVPCHRVVGSNSSLVGYAGGLWRKRWLLEHESKQQQLF